MRGLDVDAASAVRHLAERWVSRAAAAQRAGRAGRTGGGERGWGWGIGGVGDREFC